jgi:opacity protein-like surface antigen
MNIKSLLLGSAAALVAVSGARAADAIVAAEPEPVEYVRVCDAFGTGYFYIPGTETCLRIGGYVRFDVAGGELFEQPGVNGVATVDPVTGAISSNGKDTYNILTRAMVEMNTATETELGTLRTYVQTRWNWSQTANSANAFLPTVAGTNDRLGYTNGDAFSINFAFIQLGGLRVGLDESMFTTFTGYAGSVIQDTLAGGFGPFRTNLISYTYNSGAFSAALSLEQGDDDLLVANFLTGTATRSGWGIDSYMPHVVAGVGYNAGMLNLRGVFAWDSRDDLPANPPFVAARDFGGWAAKVRADVTINDMASVFAMLQYGENSSAYTTWRSGAATDETWSVIAGGSIQATEKLKLNLQGQWVESNTVNSDAWSLVGNANYTLVPGLVVTPELAYHDDGSVNGGEFGAMLRVQRSF